MPDPGSDRSGYLFHADTVDRAGCYAQFAAGTVFLKDTVHLPGCSDNGVNRAGANAFYATDAKLFINPGEYLP